MKQLLTKVIIEGRRSNALRPLPSPGTCKEIRRCFAPVPLSPYLKGPGLIWVFECGARCVEPRSGWAGGTWADTSL